MVPKCRRVSPSVGGGIETVAAAGADINQIPGALIESVDVLTGGASATYGSDAVPGLTATTPARPLDPGGMRLAVEGVGQRLHGVAPLAGVQVPDHGYGGGPLDQFVPREGATYNYGPSNYFQRPDKRWTAGLLADFDVNDRTMFMDAGGASRFFGQPTRSCQVPASHDQRGRT